MYIESRQKTKMEFEKFLTEKTKEIPFEKPKEIKIEKINQNQLYDIITSKQPSWQSIIYELIQTEQLDPWNIDIIILTQKYFEKIEELEDYYVSSKVLLAAALLLRIKSEFLLNKYIKSIDEILFGKSVETKTFEKIEIDESEIPILIPKTPLSRLKRITLNELMDALNKAIETESRRIKREVQFKRAKKLAAVDIPIKRIILRDRIRQLYAKILTFLKKPEPKKVAFSNLVGKEKEERISAFLPLLHLNDGKKIWLDQNTHLDEIWVYLYEYFEKNRDNFLQDLEKDIEEMKEELTLLETENIEKNPLEEIKEKLQKKQEKLKLQKEIEDELAKELELEKNELNKKDKIDEISGFSEEKI